MSFEEQKALRAAHGARASELAGDGLTSSPAEQEHWMELARVTFNRRWHEERKGG